MSNVGSEGWKKILLVGLLAGAFWLAIRAMKRSRLIAAARAQLGRGAKILNTAAPPIVSDDSVPNAASDGTYVRVNLDWLENVLDRNCADGSCDAELLFGIMGHELAHHVRGDARLPRVHPHTIELGADRLAGQLMAAAGLDRRHFERVMVVLSPICSASHPAGWRRVQAIEAGFHEVSQGLLA